MPFTLSHAAAVIPLRNRFGKVLPLSALLIGSFSPDFRYFIPGVRIRLFSHSLEGLFLFCLPLSLFALWVFHSLVKEPLFHLLPKSLQSRIDPKILHYSFFQLRRILVIVIAILIGAFTHIVWDSFTHDNGWAVERWPVLYRMVYHFPSYDIRVFKLLQYLSTVFGLLAVCYWFWNWFRKEPAQLSREDDYFQSPVKKGIIVILFSCAIGFGCSFGFWGAAYFKGFRAVQEFVIQTVVGCMIGATLLVFLYSVFFKSLLKRLVPNLIVGKKAE
jgi:hypothetical protein